MTLSADITHPNDTFWLRSIQWSDEILTMVPQIDEEHQALFWLYNELVAAVLDGASLAELDSKRDELHTYVNTHFQNEIVVLERTEPAIDTDLIEKHREEHAEFIRRLSVLSLRMDMSKNKTPLIHEFCRSVADLIEKHILVTDLACFETMKR